LQANFPAEDQAGSDEIHEDLEKVFKVSEYLNFPFTLEEVANYFLPKTQLTGEQLRSILSTRSFADIPFDIKDGYLFTNASQANTSRLEREQMSVAKLDSAAEFARVLRRMVPFIRTVAVTGSVAYGSADKWDDIDLFIVTKRNRLWLTAFMTLVFVRLTKFLGLRAPHLSLFCLSYVHDEQGFANESQRNRTNPLFARELLKAKPVAGAGHYRKILEGSSWVQDIYSMPYAAKLRGLKVETDSQGVEVERDSRLFSFSFKWAEGIAFVFLSRYLRIRAYLTNLKLRSQGQDFRIFEPKMSAVSCVYTSNFYEWLRGLWGK
jgi:hypothetical protein